MDSSDDDAHPHRRSPSFFPAHVRPFAERLLAWFDVHGRGGLPWQIDRTPYRVWVSEIMLQQTQAATVVPYFTRFMAAFPAVDDLAAAELDRVLGYWAGLGYYARARNLHAAAGKIVRDYGGEFPATVEGLMTLPGVGRSTAGAILALAHGKRAPILDGNAKRVLARYEAAEGWPGRAAVQKSLWEHAERHTPHTRIGEYTQAIMDLGATLCTRAQPRCGKCPLTADCKARIRGLQATLPTPRPRRARPRRDVRMLLITNADREVLLERRPPNGIWGGLYSLPELAAEDDPRGWCRRHLGVNVREHKAGSPLRHGFSHFDLVIHPLEIRLDAAANALMDREGWLWYNPAQEARVGVAAPIAVLLKSQNHSREALQ